MNFVNFILKKLGLVKIDSKENYEKNFIKFSEEKDQFTNNELFYCNYIDNSKLFTNDKVYILDIGCSEGADEIFTKFNFFSYVGCDSLEKEIIKLNNKNTHKNISYYNYTIIPPENKNEFIKKYRFDHYKNDMDYFNFGKSLAFEHVEKFEKTKENRSKIFGQLDRTKNNYQKSSTVDQIVSEKLKNNVNLMKIDIDGFTNDALYGASKTLNSGSLFFLKIEVNYTDPMEKDHFVEAYNYLYSKSFKLYRMSQRQYLHKGYFGKFIYDFPCQNFSGVDQQGDLIFIQDFDKVYTNFKNDKITLNELYKYFILLEILNFNDLAIYILNKYSDIFETKIVEDLKNLFIRKFSKSYFNKELSYQEIKEKLDSK